MDKIKGYIDHLIFRNSDNGYTVMVVNHEGEELTCVGTFPVITEGELIEATGHYTEHAVYGTQFQIQKLEIKDPEDTAAIERYLGSGVIKGIGIALAARIVRKFKEDTFRIMEEEPERLAEVKGISEKKAREISEQVSEKRDMRKAMIFLQQYGISNTLGAKIYKQYGARLYAVIQDNPYQMADDINGVGFQIADEIASKVGIHTDSDFQGPQRYSACADQDLSGRSCVSAEDGASGKNGGASGRKSGAGRKTYHGSGSRTQADTQRAGEADLRIWDQCLLHGIEYSKNAP